MIGRVFRIVRTPITLLILLGVLMWGAWWGYTNILAPIPKVPPPPCGTRAGWNGNSLPVRRSDIICG